MTTSEMQATQKPVAWLFNTHRRRELIFEVFVSEILPRHKRKFFLVAFGFPSAILEGAMSRLCDREQCVPQYWRANARHKLSEVGILGLKRPEPSAQDDTATTHAVR